ncbi:uncharacterized protein LOC114355556 isoform X1 [Ostrinia furnacalis]|uniref:uncharacterized protein LOC114355556 isoform X1 n=1 Tax=Ostrinia furnacalis TaxID=93504 RepID=UPI00103C46E6|nr:uncharacterized protein LOC114355556 isoform X1 [Ostrinia furnacalis]
METVQKARTPSRCREWERQRRNKFNEAITRLGEVVKEINRADDSTGKDNENVQYPKIEIVQKAIICLTNCAQEKTKFKAEILALHVQLEAAKKKPVTTEVSTQVYLDSSKRTQNKKYAKLKMLHKTKCHKNTLKEKAVTTNINITPIAAQNLPKLLPRTIDKKPPENTIVVLPAAPYLFPQRSLLFPTVPPAIVLVDPNIQNLNKNTVPIVTRNNGDITKTTMVNILPISAYSRPLSASKSKKNNVKLKKDGKKSNKNSKLVVKETESEVNEKLPEKTIKEKSTDKILKEKEDSIKTKDKTPNSQLDKVSEKDNKVPDIIIPISNKDKASSRNKKETVESISINNIVKPPEVNQKDISETCKDKLETIQVKTSTISASGNIEKPTANEKNSEVTNKLNKDLSAKERTLTEDKDKENKLPVILDTTLCDTAVDTGNARLELAEEFLAASPTAAFLMSFPLVSGNRADSPADEPQSTVQTNSSKDNSQRRSEVSSQTAQYCEKPNEMKTKTSSKSQTPSAAIQPKPNEPIKYTESNLITKHVSSKTSTAVSASSNENPFLNLSMPSLISTSCTVADTNFGLDFDCNISKSIPNQSSNYVSNNNIFYKSDPFSTVKNTIYSTSSITSSHDFNGLGLYPCAMEKYTSKTKSDYSNVEENLMKIGSSRLTYDIDLGWSHKSFDFVNCTTTSNTFCKDNILTTVSAPYSTTYNPFNPEFHVPLVSSANKKDVVSSKPTTSFVDTITSFYSQPTNLWSEDAPFYSNSNVSKSHVSHKNQNYLPLENVQIHTNPKPNDKHFDVKRTSGTGVDNLLKTTNVPVEPQLPEKFTKKSPTKMHINWMTSEIRPMESNCNPGPIENKDNHKSSYSQVSQQSKKQDHNESYFPISMHNFVSQPVQEEFQMWPSTRPVGPTEISIEPPPINLPTLVGDLALGPHDKKKSADITNRASSHAQDIQNCGNFLSVTQLMNRSSDNMPSRYQVPNIETPKVNSSKQSSATYFPNENNRKAMPSRLESQIPQPCYGFNDAKVMNSYESMPQFSQSKNKTIKSDKSSKTQKNNYSAEALIRGGGCTQKMPDNSNAKFIMQKYNDFNTQDNSVAQVSHFPPILDYTDNSYASQQFSGTTLYNSTTNTISNSFYSNFIPGSSNIMSTMSSNYTGGPFTSEFIDYNQADCNYTNHKYEELKMRNNPTVFPHDKVPSNYKSSRRESAAKHKLECSKKDSSKKYQSKRAKLHADAEEWNDPSHHLWQNKAPSKRHANLMSDELTFPNYVGNQMPTQYQPEFFNSHLMPSNMQSVGHNVDRSISFPVTSRANFNLSTIFPEITMKVQ